MYTLYFYTLYTYKHIPGCFDVLCESGSRKSIDELMGLLTFQIPEDDRMHTIARLFFSLHC